MALKYRDYIGYYRITEHRDKRATLICRDWYGRITHKKIYKTVNGAKRVLSRFCGGMPERIRRFKDGN